MEKKENIKHRMYRNAARLWDVKNVDNLDPLIKLLVESLASEVYKITTDITGVEIRLLERIAQLLTPDMLVIPQPAHMIMSVKPMEEKMIVDKKNYFQFDDPYKKRAAGSLMFRPVGRFHLTRGEVRAVISEDAFFTIDDTQYKEVFARVNSRSETFNNCIWIGVDIDKRIDNLKGVTFYTDFPNLPEEKNMYLPLLALAQWSTGGKPVKTVSGIQTEKNPADTGAFLDRYDLLNMLDAKIMNSYTQHFITIADDVPNRKANYTKLPEELSAFFDEGITGQIESSLLWFKVKFPPNFKGYILNDITLSMNAFPVANQELRSTFDRSRKLTNILPLPTSEHEYFLSAGSVKDESGNSYEFLPYKSEGKSNYRTYSIKRGGVERFDERDANEYLSNLIDLLRDESVAFSMLGKDYLLQAIDEMRTKISSMEQKLKEINRNKEINSYLIIDSDGQSESIFVEYWTTNCELANGIKAGTTFKPDLNLFVEHPGCVSMTTSVGGQYIPKSVNKLDMYKYVLTSRDRIFTTEDIINYCNAEFGNYFSAIEVKKGIRISDKPKEGLIRTIDVHATMKTELNQFSESRQRIGARLLKQLQERSPDAFNYRIFIQTK